MDTTNETALLTSNITYDANELIGEDNKMWVSAIKQMRTIGTPTIIGLGLLGNVFSCVVYSSKLIWKKPCSVLLTALSTVDIAFLLCLLVTLIDSEVYSLLRTTEACKCLIFAVYVTSSLSVWYIVTLTIERFVAVYWPMKCQRIFSRRREKILTVAYVPLAFFSYAYNFWTTTISQEKNSYTCRNTSESFNFLEVIHWVDTMLTMVIPFFLIATANVLIVTTLKRRTGIQGISTERHELIDASGQQSDKEQTTLEKSGGQRIKSQHHITRMLVCVSSMFLLLNLPSHVARLYNFFSAQAHGNQIVSVEFYFWQELASMLHYLTFSCNFLLYAFLGKNFQKALSQILRCRSTLEVNKRSVVAKLQATH